MQFSDEEKRCGFAVRYSPTRGRHLVATRPFTPGSQILQQEPYVAVLQDDHTPGFCDFCFRACERPLRCSRSKLARYCCKEHQRLAWSAGYKTECEALVRCFPRVPPPTVRLAARFLWRRDRALSQSPKPPPQHQAPSSDTPSAQQPQTPGYRPHAFHPTPLDSDHKDLWQLEHHWEQLDDRRKELYAQMAVVTWQYMFGSPDGPTPAGDLDEAPAAEGAGATPAAGCAADPAAAAPVWPGFKAVAQLLSRLACNCHSVCDEELRPLGVALYPTGALVNHSCRPNAVQGFKGSTLQLRALTHLRPGDEITISYVELAATRQERRESLADGYFFDVDMDTPRPMSASVPLIPESCPMEIDSGGASDGTAAAATEVTGSEIAGLGVHDSRDGSSGLLGCSSSGTGGGSGVSAGGSAPAEHKPPTTWGPLGATGLRPPPVLTLEVLANAQLLVYSTDSDQPPWPSDPWDADLTAVGYRADAASESLAAAAPGAATSTVTGFARLAGGLLARLVPRRPNEPAEADEEDEEEDDQEESMGHIGGTEAAGSARPMDALAAEGEAGPADVYMSTVGRRSPAAKPGSGLRLELPGRGARGQPHGTAHSASKYPRIEMLAWGPWISELVAAARDVQVLPDHAAAAPPADVQHDRSGAAAAAGEPIGVVAPLSTGGQADVGIAKADDDAGAGKGGGMWRPASDVQASAARRGSGGPTPAPGSEVAALLRRCAHALHLSHQAEAARAGQGTQEAVDLLLRALALLDGRPTPAPPAGSDPGPAGPLSDQLLVLGPHNVLRMRLEAQLLKAAVDHGSSGGGASAWTGGPEAAGGGVWEVALRAARVLEPPYRLVYGHLPAWPALSLHYATLAKLEMLAGRPRRALRAASKALEGLRMTHGGGGGAGGVSGGGVVEQVVQLGREAEAEAELQARAQLGPDGADWDGEQEEGDTDVRS